MSFRFKLYDKMLECLKSRPEQRFTAREIAEWIFDAYPKDCEKKRQGSTQDLSNNRALIQQIGSEIKPSLFAKNSKIKITAESPRKFYWTEKTDAEEIIEAEGKDPVNEIDTSETRLKEADLYPLLAEFLFSEVNIYSKRIDEKTSKNSRGKGGNEWLHPDIVGLEDTSSRWTEIIRECAKNAFSEHLFLWSFEVKPKLNSYNVRKAFFQAVSNSSWAHHGYLVAAEIDKNCEQELNLLANAHDIGIILLDKENPSESRILLEAGGNKDIDWDTANRIAKENNDFKEYLELVRDAYKGTALKRQKGWYPVKK